MGEIFTFVISVAALITLLLICKAVFKKNTKDCKISFSFVKGFEFSCSFYEKHNTENH
jgi:hypothetical protein